MTKVVRHCHYFLFLAVLISGQVGTAVSAFASENTVDSSLEQFSEWVSGSWDNRQQAENDELTGIPEFDRHPHYGMIYVPVNAPGIRGQLFAIKSYNEDGFDGPISRVALHRFQMSLDSQEIVHEFLFLLDKEAWGDLATDFSSLEQLNETDVRTNPQCRMYWQWQSDHFEGRTREGECITSSYTEMPILVEGHGLLYPDRLIRHDMNFELNGKLRPRQGGATSEIFLRSRVN